MPILNNLFDQKRKKKQSSLQLTLDVAPTDRFSLPLYTEGEWTPFRGTAIKKQMSLNLDMTFGQIFVLHHLEEAYNQED